MALMPQGSTIRAAAAWPKSGMQSASSHTTAPANPMAGPNTGRTCRPANARAAIHDVPPLSSSSATAASLPTRRGGAVTNSGAAEANRLAAVSAIEMAHQVSGSMPRLRLPATNSSRLQNPVITAAMI